MEYIFKSVILTSDHSEFRNPGLKKISSRRIPRICTPLRSETIPEQHHVSELRSSQGFRREIGRPSRRDP